MPSISQVSYALPSLFFSLLLSAVTTLHHLHAGLVLQPGGPALHAVWTEVVLIPIICISMYLFLKRGSRIAFWIYIAIAVLGFFALGLFEGGWNHTAKVIAYLRIDNPYVPFTDILPANNIHPWIYEISGVLTFIVAIPASYYTLRFFMAARKSV